MKGMKEKGVSRRIPNRKISLFWKYCVMMLCVQMVSTAALLVSNHMLTTKQTEFYLETVRGQILHNCENFSDALYKLYAIPEAINGTRYYDYVRGESSGIMPDKYVSVLPLLQKALNNQMFLQEKNEECLLYFSGMNCIVTRKKNFQKAEKCFDEYLRFSRVSTAELLELLQSGTAVRLLPMQEVSVGGRNVPCMSLLLHPMNSRMTVMSLYTENDIQSMLGFEALPEGSAFQLVYRGEEVLYSSCGRKEALSEEDFYEITADIRELEITAVFRIPRQCLLEMGISAKMAGMRLIGISVLLGIVLNILLSEIFTTPMSRLLQNYGGSMEEKKIISEVEYLSVLISEIQVKTRRLQALFEHAEGKTAKRRLNWLWHERLYQSILTGDKENTMHLLAMISEEPYEGTAGLESFYNTLFVLRSAAEELDADVCSLKSVRYREEESARENFLMLMRVAEEFHDYLDIRQEELGKREAARVLSFIRDNYMEDCICVQYVAKHFGLPERSVSAMVNQETGLTFGEYLLQLRMQKAGVLLCTTTLEVKKVGEMCGYFSESTFFRVFKKYYNKTPSQYRKDAGEQ